MSNTITLLPHIIVDDCWGLPHIIVDGYWVNDRTKFEGYVISQSNDIEEDDDSIFFYGLTESEIAESLGKETGEDFVITHYKIDN